MTNKFNLKFYEFIKRIFDLFFALVGIFLLLPLFGIISLLIVVSSDGPIIYQGLRTGLNSKTFMIYKFRTMIHSLEENNDLVTAKNDIRITPLGLILRKYKLDELPQLVNVLKGEMSFVGPRPEVPIYTSLYNKEEQIILSVKPGITDFSSIFFVQLADVVGSNNNKKEFANNIEEVLKVKNKLRIKYVKERSFITDLKILFKTFIKLITPR
jgi:lipopolysaccharide/colanic/teichoic acid biosynthesis glycosyltransferase